MTNTDIQQALFGRGFYRGAIDGIIGPQSVAALKAFQREAGLVADGIAGPKTQAALLAEATPTAAEPVAVVPVGWLPKVPMQGIVFHWSAGAYTPSGLDKSHYHVIIAGTGELVRGRSIADNVPPLIEGRYAAHTKGHNSSIIGVSLACMAGAIESPFSAGSAPMTPAQWQRLPQVLADLCRFYRIPVRRENVLSHAEVQRTLGIKQNGKWDITWAPGMARPGDALTLGDTVRAATRALL